jgi:L-amino acid N-acyltransferase YncA
MHIRLATVADGAACAAVYAPYVTGTSISFELVAPDGAEMGGRIARTIERTPWLVVEEEGAVRAFAYAGRFRDRAAYDWTAETAVYVDDAWRGRGLGRAAMRAVLGILRLQGFHTVIAGVTPPNPGSVRLHHALGFTRIGLFDAVGWKQDRWHGVEFFALELSPGDRPPVPVRPLPELAGTDELERALAAATA